MSLSSTVTEAVAETVITGKKWYKSKTVWSNIVATFGVGLQMKFGFIIPAEFQVFILSALNTWLRKITKEEITW